MIDVLFLLGSDELLVGLVFVEFGVCVIFLALQVQPIYIASSQHLKQFLECFMLREYGLDFEAVRLRIFPEILSGRSKHIHDILIYLIYISRTIIRQKLDFLNYLLISCFKELSNAFDILYQLLVQVFYVEELVFSDIFVELGCPLWVLEVY